MALEKLQMQPSSRKDQFALRALHLGKYSVTPDGIVLSNLGKKPRIVKQSVASDGYCRVGISIDGKVEYVKAHRLIALALIPNPAGLPAVNHKDGIKSNNHPSNLEWVSYSDNNEHAIKSGLRKPLRGSANQFSKVSEKDVAEIRRLYALGSLSQREIGLKFGIRQNTVSSIVRGTNWAHCP